MHVSSVLSVFRRMLQVLHLDVSKVNRVLHTGCAWEAGGGTSGPRGAAPTWVAKSTCGWGRAGTGTKCRHVRKTNRPGPWYRRMDRYSIGRPDVSTSANRIVPFFTAKLQPPMGPNGHPPFLFSPSTLHPVRLIVSVAYKPADAVLL